MPLHPLLSFGGTNVPTTSSSSAISHSSSSGSSTGTAVNFPHSISMPNGLPSGLSVTITPAPGGSSNPNNLGVNGTHNNNNNNNNSHGSVTITKSGGQIVNSFLENAISGGVTSMSPPVSSGSNPTTTTSTATATLQQQQQLMALASSLQSMTTNLNSMNSSGATGGGGQLNQASLIAFASKLMESQSANPIDDIVMQEMTQRLFKMNQELWQQAGVSAAVLAAGQSQGSTGQGTNQNSSPGGAGSAVNNAAVQAAQRESATAAAAAAAAQHQANEMKMAEKLVNELAVQQSTRNAFHLNERTLQECWNTLQRVSCMIFMHKSAMQLQQQQAAAAHAVHHVGTPNSQHGLIRAGSVSSGGSENGALSKPHQCQQCLKSFSSNHQLVQHIRVHTGEKPYKCSYCDRRFKQLSHVQQHTRLHTGERPYKCHVHECGRAFIQLSNLQQHLRNHDAQLERSKNRPFHCNICGKGFATESSLRTHTTKQHAALIGGPNAVTCPICHKLFLGGEALMEHMKHTHKDPNASGVATKRRTANHPCPVCGKHYVNEGSLRKHLTCHPETAQLTSSLRMWPCSVCQAVFTHETGLLTHMEQMRMDPKHQFAAQYVLSRAAAERRERENILAAAAVAAMTGNHSFGGSSQGQPMPPTSLASLMPMMPASPSGSESSGRLSSPLDTNSGLSSVSGLQHNRMSSPVNGPLPPRGMNAGNVNNNNTSSANHLNNHHHGGGGGGESGPPGNNSSSQQPREKYEVYEKLNSHLHHHNHHLENNMAGIGRDHHHGGSVNHGGGSGNQHSHHHIENGPLSNKFQAAEQAAMKMAALLGQGHGHGHGGASQNDIRNFIQHQAHGQDMMSTIQAEALLRSQAAEAIRLAVSNADRSNNSGHNGNVNSGNGGGSGSGGGENLGNNLNLSLAHQQQQEQLHRGNPVQNGHGHPSHHASLNHQLNSLLSQQDLSEALLRQLDARTLGFPLSAHNS